jgi:4-hydroxy-3-methylbut-2-enyl diphosphate reductase IspH
MKIIEDIKEVPNGENVILRAHGVTLEEMNVCKKNNLWRTNIF